VARFIPSHRQPSCCTMEGLGRALVQFPNTGSPYGVATFKPATAHGPCFFTGSLTTKKHSAAPFHAQDRGQAFLRPQGRRCPRSFLRKSPTDHTRIERMVPRRGLEPPRLAALVPETSASTNSATWACAAIGTEPSSHCQSKALTLYTAQNPSCIPARR